MPELDLTQEIEIGERKFPLWVPIAGAGVAVMLVIITKAAPAKPGAAGTVEQGGLITNQFFQAINDLAKSVTERFQAQQVQLTQIGQAQTAVANQITMAQKKWSEELGLAQSQMTTAVGHVQSGLGGVETRLTKVEQGQQAQKEAFYRTMQSVGGELERTQMAAGFPEIAYIQPTGASGALQIGVRQAGKPTPTITWEDTRLFGTGT